MIDNRADMEQDVWTPEQLQVDEWQRHPETGELVTNIDENINLTYSILSLITNLEFDLSGILGEDDTYGGKYGIALFLDNEAELKAKAKMKECVDTVVKMILE
mgnify:CR=1 FL=1